MSAAGQSENEPVALAIDVLRRLGNGECWLDDRNMPINLAALATSVHEVLYADVMSADQREVLFLRARLLNSLLFGRDAAASTVRSPLMTLDTTEEMALEEIFALPKPWALLKALSLLTTFPVLTRSGAARREALLDQAERLRDLDLPHTWPAAVLHSWVWMFCSYAMGTNRHAIKSVLNSIAERWLHHSNIRPTISQRRLVARPRLLTIAEVFKSSHVQYRYFARYLRQLRQRFEVVIAVPPDQIDNHARQLADKVVELRIASCADLVSAARLIENVHPDVVFWPSVGMATWGPFLANLRFANLQIAGLGHSASTFSRAMDYYLTEEAYVSDSKLFSERLLVLPNDSLMFEASPLGVRPPPEIRQHPEPLRVAVPGNALKLNPRFIDTLAVIEGRTSRPIEFEFFPNTHLTQADAMERAFRRRLSRVRVLPRLESDDYLKALSSCDVSLSPFPFGGLHSTIDALSLGLPTIALQGDEPHERTDALVMSRLSLPEWLLAHTASDYVNAATRVISDDSLRIQLGATIVNAQPLKAFFGPHPPGLETTVCDAVWAAYRHHDRIQASATRIWFLRDLLSLG